MNSPRDSTAPNRGDSKSRADSGNASNPLILQHLTFFIAAVGGENPFPDQEIQENLFLASSDASPADSDSSLSSSGRSCW